MSFMGARVAVKVSNGEYLCIEESNSLRAGMYDEMRKDIIFTVPAALSGAYIQTHTRDLLSVADDGTVKIKSNKELIANTESFDFICLGMNKVAIRAHNGKFVSFQKDVNKKLCAASDTIGPDEIFEVIVVFR
ncbi:fascin domain-containing protein [Ruminiclostridium cellulolyticum]|uniref:Fascin family protein n=1 Tax=Ruminiclostridium cellulolyticum (strain ATCC 35319 / DSM 5812 / JCM 6584 / H10) TaxID=394503 RepID=B8I454_RUMCH|nr:fasciclin [Ruminiclostridium cellulolyticum]ACL76487.1 Fascin family protein [Ruminiclostridium cellulolyticum H10]